MLYADAGNDEIDGNEGDDTVTYEYSPGPATVDLSKSSAQAHRRVRYRPTRPRRAPRRVAEQRRADRRQRRQRDPGGRRRRRPRRSRSQRHARGRTGQRYRELPTPGRDPGSQGEPGNPGLAEHGAAPALDTLAGIENLAGSAFADELTGDAQANTLTGWKGEDSLNAEGGNDHLAVRDGTRDLVTCGPRRRLGLDADTKGIDSIFSDCETATFAPFVPRRPARSDPEPPVPPSVPPPASSPRLHRCSTSSR